MSPPLRMIVPRKRISEFELGLMRAVRATAPPLELTLGDVAEELLFLRNAFRAILSGDICTSETRAVAMHALGRKLTRHQEEDAQACYLDADQSVVLVPADLAVL